MKTFNTIAAVMVSSAIFAGVAQAENGFYIMGGLNATTAEHGVNRNTGTNAPLVGPVGGPSLSSVDKDTGASIVVGAGYRHDFTDTFYGEIEAYYTDETAETHNINSVLVTDVELKQSFGLDVHLGHQLTDKVSLYGLFGVAQYEGDITKTYTFAPPVDLADLEETAFVYGGGVEIGITDRISTYGEFRISNDIDFSVPVDRGGVVSDNELEISVIRTGLKYKF